jgi:WD40 repeat protein
MLDGRCSLIQLSTGKILDKFSLHEGEVTAIAFDGITMASGGADGKVIVYKLTQESSGIVILFCCFCL